MYRFYGSEFAIIAKRFDSIKANQLCEAIIHTSINKLSQKYNLPENFLTIGGTPFDLYGTLNSILKSANEAYAVAKQKTNSYHLITEEQIEHNYTTLEKVVSTVIHDANFDVDYASNSYSFDNEKLVMQEVSPLIYDNNQQKLPIGSFVSIAEKINEIITFDKLVIQKVIEYLKYSKASHEIAINLAVDTISNKDFNKWLEDILNANVNLKKKIVFSITSYTASLHKHKFKKFVKHINQLEAKVLLKRYNTNDYPLEELEDIKVDYLRIDKEYTNNLANDKIKRHKVKNILIFAQLNNMEILTENVKSDNDYAFLERLGVYATSK
jgi:EAL domain-containing protein (putative c-di-GMP-specific phosphodiesterase class I)